MSIKKIFKIILDIIEIYVPSILFIIFFTFYIIQVLLRYIFHGSLMWSQEIIQYSYIWIVFLGACLAFRNNEHLALSVIYDLVPSKIQKIFDIIQNLVIGVSFILIMPSIYHYFKFLSNRLTHGMELPQHYMNFVFIIFLVIIIGRSINTVINIISGQGKLK